MDGHERGGGLSEGDLGFGLVVEEWVGASVQPWTVEERGCYGYGSWDMVRGGEVEETVAALGFEWWPTVL